MGADLLTPLKIIHEVGMETSNSRETACTMSLMIMEAKAKSIYLIRGELGNGYVRS